MFFAVFAGEVAPDDGVRDVGAPRALLRPPGFVDWDGYAAGFLQEGLVAFLFWEGPEVRWPDLDAAVAEGDLESERVLDGGLQDSAGSRRVRNEGGHIFC